MTTKIKWACPKCGATPEKGCGTGPCIRNMSGCMGFLCECEDEQPHDHGESQEKPCRHAACNHCGWAGRFPPKPKHFKRRVEAEARTAAGGACALLACHHWLLMDVRVGSQVACPYCRKVLP